METRYQAYLKTHCFVNRFFLNLCWWKTSVRGAYMHSLDSLAAKVAEGYEDKMISLLACKHILKSPLHRSFCAQALSKAYSNTYKKDDPKGHVWKIENEKGVVSYLIGTAHQGTSHMGQIKGIQEAISQSEVFFTGS